MKRTVAVEFAAKFKGDHPIKIFMDEHLKILEFMSELEEVTEHIGSFRSASEAVDTLRRLEWLSRHISGTERHHIREENVFMNRLANAKYIDIIDKRRKEHDELRVLKNRLSNHILQVYRMDFRLFVKQLIPMVSEISGLLKQHIHIEDTELYPLFEKVLEEVDIDTIKLECDRIGYCCFTPGKTNKFSHKEVISKQNL